MSSRPRSSVSERAEAVRSRRDGVLTVFRELVLEGGEGTATVERVADRAGLSRGGLLHHFPTRAALADALSARLIAQNEAMCRELRDEHMSLGSFLRQCAQPGTPLRRDRAAVARLSSSGLFSSAHEGLLTVFQARHTALSDLLIDPVVALAVAMVADGLMKEESTSEARVQSRPDSGGSTRLDALIACVEAMAPGTLQAQSAQPGSPSSSSP